MPPSPSLVCIIIFFFFFFFISSLPLSSSSTIKLSLSPFPPQHPSPAASSSASWDLITQLTASSLTRAHHLKRRPKSSSSAVFNTQLSPHSYGGYTIDLSFGTPPQKLTFVMDTGSSLVWFPCTSRYTCSRCDFPNVDPAKIAAFIPKRSSSAKLVGCRNPKCGWVFGPEAAARCSDCSGGSQNCSQTCPVYLIQYGSGNTGGVLLSETLDFSGQTVPDFLIGCSVFSSRQPAGIAGFGRGPESLPAQMGLKKFSYCLLSRRFDDTAQSSNLVLETGSRSDDDPKLDYTPFRKNPGSAGSTFKDYYYVGLRKIFVGWKDVKVPYKYLVPGENGDGGVIVDSGSTFTFMERPVFEAVAGAFENYLVNVSRAKEVEAQSGLRPCYDVSGRKEVALPELEFHFKGGAKMALPAENYFAFFSSADVVCATIVTDGVVGPEVSGGPAIIVGSFQQQNYYVEYDLENERFGFRKQSCSE